MSGKMGFSEEDRHKNTGLTVVLAVLCALGIILPRSFGSSATVIMAGGRLFAYTDAFIILAAGIGGLPAGILTFSIAFVAEAASSSNFYSIYTMSTYILMVLLASGLAYGRCYAGVKRLPAAVLILTVSLAFLWEITTVHARMKNPYSDMPFHNLMLCALPEITVSVLVQRAYFRLAPDWLKELLGSGWRYTEAYRHDRTHGSWRTSIMGLKMLFISFVSTLAICAVVIVLATIYNVKGPPGALNTKGIFTVTNLRLMLVSASVAFPLSYLMNIYSQRTVAQPLNKMSYLMEQYFSGDDRHQVSQLPDLKIRTKDEIRKLYDSLQKMLADMTGYMETEAQKRKLEADLQVEKASGKAKSDFLSSMSHEIRTPINAVLGLDEMILRESGEDAVLEYAREIQDSGRMLLSIINDILDFSKIEAGKMDIVPAEYDTGSMINDLVSMVAPRAEAKGLLFTVNAAPDLPRKLFGDDNRIKQCVLNLLTNAVKYTREGSVTLDIRSSPAGEGRILLDMHVLDTGIGIKEEDIQKLFSPFERIEENRNRNIEGTGLGMSIVKGLISSMDGELTVRSEYGKGSDFAIALKQEVRDTGPMGDWRPAAGTAGTEGTRHRYEESFQAPEARILVVDDTPLNVTVIKGLLKATRIQVDTAADGEAGLALAGDSPYNVILIDHLMPKMDGIEMLERLRQDRNSPNRDTPCIALTANAISGAKEMYLQAGFTDYLSKPVDPALLESMLSSLLPQSLVIRRGEAGFTENGWQTGIPAAAGVSDGLFRDLFGLDIGKALENCGNTDIFLDTLRVFFEYISSNAEKIAGFADAGDWKNYTILVHALKSSARLIGLEQLSDEARRLEELGKQAQEDDKAAVMLLQEGTPPMLEHYRACGIQLEPLVKR